MMMAARGGTSQKFSSPSQARALKIEPKQALSISKFPIEPTSSQGKIKEVVLKQVLSLFFSLKNL